MALFAIEKFIETTPIFAPDIRALIAVMSPASPWRAASWPLGSLDPFVVFVNESSLIGSMLQTTKRLFEPVTGTEACRSVVRQTRIVHRRMKCLRVRAALVPGTWRTRVARKLRDWFEQAGTGVGFWNGSGVNGRMAHRLRGGVVRPQRLGGHRETAENRRRRQPRFP